MALDGTRYSGPLKEALDRASTVLSVALLTQNLARVPPPHEVKRRARWRSRRSSGPYNLCNRVYHFGWSLPRLEVAFLSGGAVPPPS